MTTMALYNCYAMILGACMCVVLGNTPLKFRARKNMKLPENIVDKTIAADGLVTCVVLCKSETAFQCEAASWGDETCLLSKTVTIHASLALEENAEWTTMCRIMYPVFHTKGDLGPYTLSFEAAQLKCENLGSRIASRLELLAARAMGFEYCSCGWLSDETCGYVMQAEQLWCGYSDGIIGCGGPADVYCSV